MVHVGTHGNLGHIHVTIGNGHQPQILLAHSLTRGGKLGHGSPGRCFGRLATGVGIDLRIQNEYVQIIAHGQHMIQASIANIVGPAIPSDDPL